MSDNEHHPGPALAERLRLGAGFGVQDRHHVLELLSALNRHLAHWSPEQVDVAISVKNRGGIEQKVTLEAWLPGWPSLIATSTERELDHALIEVRRELMRQIEDEKEKRHLHKTKTSRRGTS